MKAYLTFLPTKKYKYYDYSYDSYSYKTLCTATFNAGEDEEESYQYAAAAAGVAVLGALGAYFGTRNRRVACGCADEENSIENGNGGKQVSSDFEEMVEGSDRDLSSKTEGGRKKLFSWLRRSRQ